LLFTAGDFNDPLELYIAELVSRPASSFHK